MITILYFLDGYGYANAGNGRNAGHAWPAAHGSPHRGPRPWFRARRPPGPNHVRPAHVADVPAAAPHVPATRLGRPAAAQLPYELGAALTAYRAAVAAQYGAAFAAHGAESDVPGAYVAAPKYVAASQYVAAS